MDEMDGWIDEMEGYMDGRAHQLLLLLTGVGCVGWGLSVSGASEGQTAGQLDS